MTTDTNSIQFKVGALNYVIEQLAPGDRSFAESLIRNFEKYNKLSSKQIYWVEKLTKRAEEPVKPVPVVEVGNLSKLMSMFAIARENLKFPKIRLHVNSQPVQLHVAGERSKYHGKVMVTDGERFGQNQWWGAISESGEWTQPRNGVPADVVEIINRMSEDPAKTAQEYGALTGHCCFCGKKLTDDRSTTVGYGATCAKNYGLAWGAKSSEWKEV